LLLHNTGLINKFADMLLFSQKTRTALFFSILFFAFGLIRIHYHEMWCDETQPWLLARDSHSYADLIFNKRYEGHPAIWYTLVYWLTFFTQNAVAMQYLHTIISAAVAFVFIRFAPFPLILRILFCLGYFPLFEYGTISRLYSLGLLFIFLLCAVYPYRYQKWYLFCLLLFFCAQTNFFGGLFAGSLLAFCLFDHFKNLKNNQNLIDSKKFWGGLSIAIAGFLLGSYVSNTPPDNYYADITYFYWFLYRFNITIFRLWDAFVPIPHFQINFWGTNIIDNFRLKVLLSALVLGLSLIALSGSRKFTWLYLFLTVVLLLFFYLKFDGFIRHHGHLYIYFIACLWLSQTSPNSENNSLRFQKFRQTVVTFFLPFLLILQVTAGAIATYYDFKYPFSGNKAIANYINKQPGEHLIVVLDNFFSSPISAYTGQQLYSPVEQRIGSFFQFSRNLSRKDISPEQCLDEGFKLMQRTKKPVFVVMYKELDLRQKPYAVKKALRTGQAISGEAGLSLYYIPLEEHTKKDDSEIYFKNENQSR
jgi:hypothetical protein